mmetsp:Transcript_15314/g.42713  ORF Transcript_15314/g.42713 Transcript_15314/m.42713 type:complete len:83 (-) Transcript_15314:179-427(-)
MWPHRQRQQQPWIPFRLYFWLRRWMNALDDANSQILLSKGDMGKVVSQSKIKSQVSPVDSSHNTLNPPPPQAVKVWSGCKKT